MVYYKSPISKIYDNTQKSNKVSTKSDIFNIFLANISNVSSVLINCFIFWTKLLALSLYNDSNPDSKSMFWLISPISTIFSFAFSGNTNISAGFSLWASSTIIILNWEN